MKPAIRTLTLSFIVVALMMPVTAFAFDTEFHGYLESRSIFRDTSGFQYGFMDDMYGVQWIQELQMDMTVRPEYPEGKPPIRLEKAFLRYRGSYDAIYDLTDRYDDIPEDDNGKFRPGRRTLKLDQDLREAFADIIIEKRGLYRSNLRLGKQIVQWGEADVFNLINIVNPNDYYNKAFFSAPEQLLAPLWMGRYDLSVPTSGFFSDVNLQLLAIPDVRPHVFGPLNGPYNAVPLDHDIDSSMFENTEFGVRLGATTLSSAFYLYYFDGYQDGPAVNLNTFTLEHPKTKTMGYSFSRFFDLGNFVLRGEGSLTTDKTFQDFETMATGGDGYAKHDFYQVLFGIDKSLSGSWVGAQSALTTAVQVYYSKIDDWDENEDLGRTAPEETWRGTLLLTTDYIHGTLTPTINLMYDSEDALLAYLELKWCPNGTWYTTVTSASIWGDGSGYGDYNPYIETQSEVQLKFGYQW